MNTYLISQISKYLKSVPIERAWIFGSVSRGEDTPESDIDIMVEFEKGKKIGLLYFKILSELESICNRPVDLAEAGMIDTRVLKNVNADRILIYERTYAR